MKATLENRLSQIRNDYAIECKKKPSAKLERVLELIIIISALSNRIMEKQQQLLRLTALEQQKESTVTNATTYQGIGLNTSTALTALQITATVINGAVGQAVGAIKGLNDEAKQGNRTMLSYTSDKARMVADDILRDAQKLQSLMNELSEILKQMYNSESNATSRMAGR